MEVIIGLHAAQLNGTQEDIARVYRDFCEGNGLIRFAEEPEESGFLSSRAMAGLDSLEITVKGNGVRTDVIARFDNLGKGASGAAIQNMNLVLGLEETRGLIR